MIWFRARVGFSYKPDSPFVTFSLSQFLTPFDRFDISENRGRDVAQSPQSWGSRPLQVRLQGELASYRLHGDFHPLPPAYGVVIRALDVLILSLVLHSICRAWKKRYSAISRLLAS